MAAGPPGARLADISDIGSAGLERLAMIILAVLIAGPPLVIGAVFLLLHALLPGHGKRGAVLYFVTSIVTLTGVMV